MCKVYFVMKLAKVDLSLSYYVWFFIELMASLPNIILVFLKNITSQSSNGIYLL